MNKTYVKLSVIALCLFFSLTANAKAIKMIFWYPGEAGGTVEAQPVLDAFFTYINDKIAPAQISGQYYNTVNGGINAINGTKPALAIISYAAYAQNKQVFKDTAILVSTLPIPHGQKTESYTLVGTKDKLGEKETVYSSEPLSLSFIKTELFGGIGDGNKPIQTAQLLAKLKEIGEGKLDAVAILTPNEAASLARLTAPWAKALKTIAISNPVPTAYVILLDKSFDASKLKTALLSMASDPKAKDILDEMRLKGFAQ